MTAHCLPYTKNPVTTVAGFFMRGRCPVAFVTTAVREGKVLYEKQE